MNETYREILEAKDDTKLLSVDDTIWFTYGPNSGIAVPLKNKSYLTDKKGDDNFDNNLVSKMLKFAKTNKPIKEKGNLKLYPIPVYSGNNAQEYDILEKERR